MAPHLDPDRRVERAHAADLSAAARDREANAARVHCGICGSPFGGGKPKSVHCGICGSPFGDRTKYRNACADCARRDFEDWAREKLGPEEIYPEHFPESTNE